MQIPSDGDLVRDKNLHFWRIVQGFEGAHNPAEKALCCEHREPNSWENFASWQSGFA